MRPSLLTAGLALALVTLWPGAVGWFRGPEALAYIGLGLSLLCNQELWRNRRLDDLRAIKQVQEGWSRAVDAYGTGLLRDVAGGIIIASVAYLIGMLAHDYLVGQGAFAS
jgi:hypothetical protein